MDLVFICVVYGDALKDNGLRKDVEKYVAYKTLCRYWANGGQYKKKETEEINLIKEKCKEQCTTLFENIKGRYGEKANSIKEFLECLTNGTFNSSFPEKCKINESK